MLFLVTISFPKSFSIRIVDEKSGSSHGAALIEESCRNTSSYDLCVSSFKSNPKSFKADILGLLRISIDLANLNASRVLHYIDNLIKTSKDVSASVKWCREDYHSSMHARNKAIEALTGGDYLSTNVDISAAGGYTYDCKDEFTMASPTTSSSVGLEELPPELVQMNEIMLKLDDISIEILCRNFMTCD
ncbi:pectinesterase inhibitor-like [Papaver somniferum]|uniref:pectinesterase inhibitor-like n=1 Tax=Papaver somniferum TaxID=3469 RepID=UPI000E6FA1CA|nr:pectinesterase inhibitor-like [Papaver somniferum]